MSDIIDDGKEGVNSFSQPTFCNQRYHHSRTKRYPADFSVRIVTQQKNLHQITTQHPFNFHNGRSAHSVAELQKLCQDLPEAAGWHLQSGHFDTWLSDNGRPDLARYIRNTFRNFQVPCAALYTNV